MSEIIALEVLLHGNVIGTLTRLPGDRILFAFDPGYIEDPERPTLSLSFKDQMGGLITDIRPTQTRLPPFFANLLPEGAMRDYLARRAGVNEKREFFLLWALGHDLPGGLTIRPLQGQSVSPAAGGDDRKDQFDDATQAALRFSLAGVQLKFSAVMGAAGGLTIPAQGVGGDWIVKLPSLKFEGVPENEFAMMTLAHRIGINVPEVKLVELRDIAGLPEGIGRIKGSALAVKRFDRTAEGMIHMEDFAQIFSVYPERKYERASYRNIAEVIWAEIGNEGIAEFIRRLIFSVLIGNADMHLKNWSLIYPGKRHAALSPAYDFVSTIAWINDDSMALSLVRTKKMSELSRDTLALLAAKARLPERLVLNVAKETVERFMESWPRERGHLPLSTFMIEAIDTHLAKIALVREL
ncbi:MAG: HipA domain-containing protein [Gammaproteobacteria bacterium]|nr:HipA domain-containing protein [Gammaproteobacteria bacterium]